MPLPPRLGISTIAEPLPSSIVFGRKITRSADDVTSPLASRGARSRSTMDAFAFVPGLSAKKTRATIFSYGPATSNALPSLISTRETISTRTTRASAVAPSTQHKNAHSAKILFIYCSLGATADARVVRVEIVSRVDIKDGKAFDAAGPYEKIVARVFFADKPGTKANASIVDLDLAPRDANGDVTSSADLVILRPKTMELGNGSAIVEIPNRGGKGILSYLNHAV